MQVSKNEIIKMKELAETKIPKFDTRLNHVLERWHVSSVLDLLVKGVWLPGMGAATMMKLEDLLKIMDIEIIEGEE